MAWGGGGQDLRHPQPHCLPPALPTVPPLLPSLHTCVAAVHPDTLPIVLAPAPHHIVGEVRFSHLMLGVHDHLGRARGRAGVTAGPPRVPLSLGQAGPRHAPWGAEQHPDVQGEGCWWCPWRVAPSPELQWLGAPPAPPSPYLEGVAARRHVSNVNPLAVDVVAVGVPAPHAHPLLPKVGTGEASLQPCGREGR